MSAATASTRRPLVSGNWKMHHDHIEALHTVRDLGLRLKPEDVARVDVSVHPPFTDLRTVQTLVEKEHLPLALGAQHCSDEDAGARTGEVSPRFLARLATAYVIVGHSERRILFGMDDATVASTLRAVLRNGMTPVLCVGESEEQRDGGHTEGVLEEQVLAALSGLAADVVAGLVHRLRAHLGHRHAARRPPPSMPRTPASSSAPWWPRWAGTRRPPRCASSTGAR